ncbi:MAG: DNA recombination protein RmuC [Bacteroidales bacterium]|nr:DNA recombination protein RmuC [Bacteroidales bacterium]
MSSFVISVIAVAAAAGLFSALAAFLLARRRFSSVSEQKDRTVQELRSSLAESELKVKLLEKDVERGNRTIEDMKRDFRTRLEEEREVYEKSLKQQLDAVKNQISVESEKVLKARQEEFSKSAKESFSTIAGDFNKNLQDMKTAFEASKKTQTESSTEMKTKLEEAVKNLKDSTSDIGKKADNLASALRGQNKMQGCWGETQLANVLADEGLREGRDFDREETLRNELGLIVKNEDTGKRMRPDFILHYPDNTDIIVDCKVSLNALSDYMSAEDDAAREDAAVRNLKAVNDQVEGLSRKDYASYLRPGHKCLDYTVMYVPNVNALVLARQKDPLVVANAFRKGVLITSEETFIPFLNLVRSAWVNTEQARNQEKIITAAQRMIDRVADFCDAYAQMGRKLEDARNFYDKGAAKISESGQSILHAAREVVSLGVKGKKSLPAPDAFGTPHLLSPDSSDNS